MVLIEITWPCMMECQNGMMPAVQLPLLKDIVVQTFHLPFSLQVILPFLNFDLIMFINEMVLNLNTILILHNLRKNKDHRCLKQFFISAKFLTFYDF